MVHIMDQAVGNVTAALAAKQMADDTLIVFSADNGGVYHSGQLGNNYPLRGTFGCASRSIFTVCTPGSPTNCVLHA